MTWQPIETAPKDESWILLWFPDFSWRVECHVQVGFWSDTEDGDWYDSEAAPNSMAAFGQSPTHWMPLPTPPNPQQEGRG